MPVDHFKNLLLAKDAVRRPSVEGLKDELELAPCTESVFSSLGIVPEEKQFTSDDVYARHAGHFMEKSLIARNARGSQRLS